MTKTKPFRNPDTVYLRRLARPVFMIQDIVEGCPVSRVC